MNFLSKSVAAKINAIIVGYSLVVLVVFAVYIGGNLNSLESYDTLLDKDVAAANTVGEMATTFKIQVQEWKNVLLRGHDTKNREKYWGKFQATEAKIQEKGQQLIGELTNQATITEVKSFLENHKTLGTQYRKGFDAFVASGYNHVAGDKAVSGIDRAPTSQLTSLQESIVKQYSDRATKVRDSAYSSTYTTIVLVAVLMPLFIFVSVIGARIMVVKPLQQVVESIANLIHGKMDVPIEINRQDELGDLGTTAEKLRKSLQEVSNNIESTAHTVSGAADTFKSTADTIRTGTQDQTQRTEMVATAIEEMTAAAHEVARNASSAAAAAEEADRSANNGTAVMQATIDTINTMASEVENAANVIAKLEQDTNSVGSVLDVIRGIAEQTNLLALNAAIEAARAGEQGRGFAVVADEVRTLAMRTSESTAEIQEIIENVQNGARNAVSAIASGTTRTQEGVEQVGEAGRALESITSAVSEIRDMNGQIATAAEEQTSVSNEIAANITQISSIAEANLNNISNTSTLAQNLVQNAAQLREAVRKLTHGA